MKRCTRRRLRIPHRRHDQRRGCLALLNTATITHQAAIFVYFPLEEQVRLVEGTGRPHMARLIEQMSHDDRVDLLRGLEPKVVESLLRLVDEADRRDIATLVKYPENTAGSLMTTDYAWLPANITVDQALDRLRLQAPDSETIYYLYVVDDQRRLLGVVSLRELILAPPGRRQRVNGRPARHGQSQRRPRDCCPGDHGCDLWPSPSSTPTTGSSASSLTTT